MQLHPLLKAHDMRDRTFITSFLEAYRKFTCSIYLYDLELWMKVVIFYLKQSLKKKNNQVELTSCSVLKGSIHIIDLLRTEN